MNRDSFSSRTGLGMWVAALSCRLIFATTGFADDKPAKSAPAPTGAAKDKAVVDHAKDVKPKNAFKGDKPGSKGQIQPSSITAERESAALQFARVNHPELALLLDSLKQNAPGEYQAALADLDRTVERLSKLKEKSVERYEFEVADWKATSRIRLLAARLTMSDDPTVEAELRAMLRERLDLRLANQRAERDRMQSRIAKLDQMIDETSAKADAIVEKQFADLRKAMPSKPVAKAKAKRPSANPPKDAVQGEQK